MPSSAGGVLVRGAHSACGKRLSWLDTQCNKINFTEIKLTELNLQGEKYKLLH